MTRKPYKSDMYRTIVQHELRFSIRCCVLADADALRGAPAAHLCNIVTPTLKARFPSQLTATRRIAYLAPRPP